MFHSKKYNFCDSTTKPSAPLATETDEMLTSRRSFIRNLTLGAAIVGVCPVLSFEPAYASDRPHEFQWRVPKAHFKTVQDELKFNGDITHDNDAKGLPLVYIFAGAVLLPYLAKAVLALRRQMVYGGVVIDARGEKIDIQTDKSLPGGAIVVVTTSGANFYEPNEIESPAMLTDILSKAQ